MDPPFQTPAHRWMKDVIRNHTANPRSKHFVLCTSYDRVERRGAIFQYTKKVSVLHTGHRHVQVQLEVLRIMIGGTL